jgi:hypothetical protein
MLALLKLYRDICLLRAAPQDLPFSHFLMLLCILCYALVGLGVSLLDQGLGLSLLSAGVDTALMIGLAYLGLWIRDRGARAVQTITALTGTGAFFGLLGWPLIASLQQVADNTPSSLSLLLLALIVWNITVIGHILRHALDIPLWVGTGVALLYIYTSIRVMSVLHIAGTTAS